MKPDGTHTIEEILEMCNTELQSWERSELAEKLDPIEHYYRQIRNMDIEELENITGYYIYDEKPEPDIDDFSMGDLINEIVDRLRWCSIFESDKIYLLDAIHNAKTIKNK